MDQSYTLTDAELFYKVNAWSAYPENCVVRYDYRLSDEDGAPVEPAVEQMIEF